MNTPLACVIIREMSKKANVTNIIEERLPAELLGFVQLAGKLAAKQEQSLYLVGGMVRDLFLGKPNIDLDLVIEGNATTLAKRLAEIKPVKIITHPRFNTAQLKWNNWGVDLATARSESYAEPGALPTVRPISIDLDLFRRDFTINAMAICLHPTRYGELIDRYGGRSDLEHRLIRILHENSFIDDATRIWRGLRYEQRLNFKLEDGTLKLLRRDISMLDTISGDRIRYELECIFREEQPENVLNRADALGVLSKLHPGLKGDGWLSDKFKIARQLASPGLPSFGLYFALLFYRLTSKESKQFAACLRLPKQVAQSVRDAIAVKAKLPELSDPELSPSSIYRLLHGYSMSAVTANLIASDSPTARRHLETFSHKLRYVKSVLNGNDLISLGVAPGSQIKEILHRLHGARLDRKVTSRQGEEELVKRWIKNGLENG
jgi:tRNA nucleotidyltransferase (CCA-adding enzyme)